MVHKLRVGLYRLNEELEDVQKIINCFETLKGEVFPAIFLTKSSRGTIITYCQMPR